jgi:hypothetical protein
MQDGVMNSFYDLTIRANELKLRNYTNQAGGRIELAVTNYLADSGAGANVVFVSTQGISLTRKPASGSLLGTEVQVRTTQGAAVECYWAADDKGASASGYEDNAAIGRLSINPALNGQVVFRGTGSKNAIYVDLLEFSTTAQADLQGALVVDPNFTIYYSASNVLPEVLESTYGGRVKQVLDFAGPYSSVDVLVVTDVNTQPPKQATFTVPRSLRESLTVDSDADGTANRHDASPFQGPKIIQVTLTGSSPQAVRISWKGAVQTTYRVDYTTALGSGNWVKLKDVTNSSSSIQTLVVEDPLTTDGQPRYYRVSYLP